MPALVISIPDTQIRLEPSSPARRVSLAPSESAEAISGGTSLSGSAIAQSDDSELLLSPASRRRLRKRLYMRRKRAEKTGEAVNQSLTRLKPGRKSKSRKSDLSEKQAHVTENSDGEIDEREGRVTRHHNLSGKTLPYKIRARFDTQHIDAERLRQEGLGLFHMAGLSRLMRYNAAH